jgi:REP element-mobilizing transposase RayT
MNKYKNKYRIPTNRLQGYDYSANGCYYVTICTKNREHYFGEIVNDVDDVETQCIASLRKTEIGRIAEMEWLKTIELRSDMNLILDEFVIMPNHIHGIIIIGENQYNTEHGIDAAHRRDAMHCVSTMQCVSTSEQSYKNKFDAQSKNIASIIRGFKIAVTTYTRKNNIDFAWQERFHDRIIRTNDELANVRTYIANNPVNWNDDELNEK